MAVVRRGLDANGFGGSERTLGSTFAQFGAGFGCGLSNPRNPRYSDTIEGRRSSAPRLETVYQADNLPNTL